MLEQVLKPFFYLLYSIIYLYYSFFEYLKHRPYPSAKQPKPLTPYDVHSHIAPLKQLPLHIGILVDSHSLKIHQSNIEQVMEIALWCMAARIPFITVYDEEGIMKKDALNFQKELKNKIAVFYGQEDNTTEIPPITFINSPQQNLSAVPSLLRREIDKTDNNSVSFSFISAEDGRANIVHIVKEIAKEMSNEREGAKDLPIFNDNGSIDKKKLQNKLDSILFHSEEKYWPPPDFLLKFGNRVVWNGFLPWQIRYSEILFLGSLSCFDFGKFLSSMKRFDQCGRRFGK